MMKSYYFIIKNEDKITELRRIQVIDIGYEIQSKVSCFSISILLWNFGGFCDEEIKINFKFQNVFETKHKI